MKYNVNSFVLHNQILKYFIEDNDSDIFYPIELKNVEKIRDYAFYGKAYMNELIIPNSVKYIGTRALADCVNLVFITFKGTVEEWRSIEFGYGWSDRSAFYEIKCIDGTIDLREEG